MNTADMVSSRKREKQSEERTRGKIRWLSDPVHSKLTFKVKHMVISSVSGHFDDLYAEVWANETGFNGASIYAEIDAASLTTGLETRDNHLRSDDFFDVARYPKITFESLSMTAKNARTLELRGQLKIKNVVKELVFPVEYIGTVTDAWGKTRAGFSFQLELDRFELGLTWDVALKTGAAIVGKKVKLSGEIELVKQEQETRQDDEEKQDDIQDSLKAAARTHLSQLPPVDDLKTAFADAFVIYEPKDQLSQLSGDFYWFEKYPNAATLVLADCVGHGIEGALKAMIGVSLLNQTANKNTVRDLKALCTAVHDAVVQNVRKSQTPNPNLFAMDMGFCTFDYSAQQIHFLGAGISLYVLRTDGTLECHPAYKEGVGSRYFDPDAPQAVAISVQSGDRCFLATDGLADQFGGESSKKSGRKTVEQWLTECAKIPFAECQSHLKRQFSDWRGRHEQMDDVTVIGFQPL
jgi:polyisoprenoid-binding protein YceI